MVKTYQKLNSDNFRIYGAETGMISSEKIAARRGLPRTFFLLFFLVAGSGPALAQKPTTATRLEHAEKEPQNWLTYYGNYNGWSYSQLNQITPRRFAGLDGARRRRRVFRGAGPRS